MHLHCDDKQTQGKADFHRDMPARSDEFEGGRADSTRPLLGARPEVSSNISGHSSPISRVACLLRNTVDKLLDGDLFTVPFAPIHCAKRTSANFCVQTHSQHLHHVIRMCSLTFLSINFQRTNNPFRGRLSMTTRKSDHFAIRRLVEPALRSSRWHTLDLSHTEVH